MFLILNSNLLWAQCDVGVVSCPEIKPTVDNIEITKPKVEQTTDELIDSITDDLMARRLTKPTGNNALQKIKLLRTIDPEHDYSINGVRYVARIYLSMARKDLENNLIERARARFNSASETDPSLPGLQAIAKKLDDLSSASSPTNVSAGNKTTDAVEGSRNTGKSSSAVSEPGPQVTEPIQSTVAGTTGNSESLENGDETLTPGIRPTAGDLIVPVMVGLPAGAFVMGSESGASNEKPAHQVQVEAFSMSRYEITREQYNVFMSDTGSDVDRPPLSQALLPVAGITSNEAAAYTRWLSEKTGKRYRLPTEEEWEYAARAGTMTPYHSGDTVFGGANCLTCLDEIPRSAMPVGTFEPNNFGLYDMHGNVAEWTSSCLTDNHIKDNQNTEQQCTKHVVRGGSWRSTRDQVRSSFRVGQPVSGRAMGTGIRVVHDGL